MPNVSSISPIQAWTRLRIFFIACAFIVALGMGLRLGTTEYAYDFKWVHFLVLAELTGAIALGACFLSPNVKRRREYLVMGLILHSITIGVAVSVSKQHFRIREKYTSIATNPETRERLPTLQNALYDGTWASSATMQFLVDCRRAYPTETKEIDTYIAAWHFCHKDSERGEAALRRLGRYSELIHYFEAHGEWDKIEQVARDRKASTLGRVEACLALARRADVVADETNAVGYCLEALEYCLNDPLLAELQQVAWQSVRKRLGKTITHQQYAASLHRWAMQVTDKAVIESIVFELGKLQVLEKLPGRGDSKL
jgi:hypothetical protein